MIATDLSRYIELEFDLSLWNDESTYGINGFSYLEKISGALPPSTAQTSSVASTCTI